MHLVRNSFRSASKKDGAAVAATLKPVYTAPSEAAALEQFLAFAESDLGRRYPAIIRLWENAWAEFVPFLAFDHEIRTVICTTHAIESLNARYRKAVNARGHFPTEQAALTCLYLATMALDPTGTARTKGNLGYWTLARALTCYIAIAFGPVTPFRISKRWSNKWKSALNACDVTFDGRLTTGRK